MKPPKPKTCIICKTDFKPFRTTEKVCSVGCALTWAKSQAYKQDKAEKKQMAKEWNKRKSVALESLKTVQDYTRVCQRMCNSYINIRDRGKPCISCGCRLEERKVNASHFYPTKGYPELRFDPDNIHSSCIPCNKDLHGNLHEYRKRLPERIGQEAFELLESKKGVVVQYRIPELKQMILDFGQKIKALKASH